MWENILKISNERASSLAHEYARADYDAGKEENAERISKPLLEEIDKFSDIVREYMADTKGEAKERFEETLDVLRFFRRKVFKNEKYQIKTATEAKEFRKRLIPVKKFLVRTAGIPASEFNWFRQDILKKDSDLTDEQQKQIKEVQEAIKDAFNKLDLSTINMIVAPHGRKEYSSKAEFINDAIKDAVKSMKERFNTE